MNKNFSTDDIKKAVKNNDTSSLLSMLSEEDKKLFDTLLNDKKSREEFLSSKNAKAIISSLFEGR